MGMLFGTMNAPTDFQGYIDNTLKEALDERALPNLDDIPIYSTSKEEHVEHVKLIIQRLLEAK